jgi:hypothetical protein
VTQDELAQVARLLEQRTLEVGNGLDPKTSSFDVAICEALKFVPTTESFAANLARLACAYRGRDAADPRTERDAMKQAMGKRGGFKIAQAVRARLLELCAIPATAPQVHREPAPRRDERPALERLEDAIDRELAKPYREQRPHLLSKWRSELALHDDSRAFA